MPVMFTIKPTSRPTASPTNHPDHSQYIISLSFFVTLIYILILLIFLYIRRKYIAEQQQRGYSQHAMIRFCNQYRCTFLLTTDFDTIIQASLGKGCKFFLCLSRFIYFICFSIMFALLNDQEHIKGWGMYYFTNWTILVVAIYFFLSFISSFIAIYLKLKRNPYEASLNLEIEWSCTMRCLGVIIHLLYEIAGASSCFVLVFDYLFMNSKNNSIILIFARIVTLTSLILELLMNNIDVRFDQYPATAAFLMMYLLFIWPTVTFGNLDNWPYDILSVSSRNCYGYYLLIFILNFMFYCVWYSLYILKRELYIYYDIGRFAIHDEEEEHDYQHVGDEERGDDGSRISGGGGGRGGGFRLTDAEVQSIGINESVIHIKNSILYDDTTTSSTTFDYLNTIVFDESSQLYEKDFESSTSPLYDNSNSWIKAEQIKNITYNNYDNNRNDKSNHSWLNVAVPILSPMIVVGKTNKNYIQSKNKANTTFETTNLPFHNHHQQHHHSVNITPTTTTKSSVSVSSVLNGLITLEQVRKRSSSDDNYDDDDDHNGHMVMKASSTDDYHQSYHHSSSLNLVNRFNINRGISSSSLSVFDQNDNSNHHHDSQRLDYHDDYYHDNYDDAMMSTQSEHNIKPLNDAIFSNDYHINIHEKSLENDIIIKNISYDDEHDNNHNYDLTIVSNYQNDNNKDDDDDISTVRSKKSNNVKTNHNFFERITNVMSDKMIMMMTTTKEKSTEGLVLSPLQSLSGINKKSHTFPLNNDYHHHNHQLQKQQQLHHTDELEHVVNSGNVTTSSSSSYAQGYFDFNTDNDNKNNIDDNYRDLKEATYQASVNNNDDDKGDDHNHKGDDDDDSLHKS